MKNLCACLFLLFVIAVTAPVVNASDNVQDLIKKANTLYLQGKYVDAAGAFEQAVKLGKVKPDVYYNMACCWALAGETDKAFNALKAAPLQDLCGFYDDLKKDRDLISLHSDGRWPELMKNLEVEMEKVKAKIPEKHTILATVELPAPQTDGTMPLEKAINRRRSRRRYTGEALTLKDVSQILWAAYGLTKPIDGAPEFLRGGLRAAPSAGARYPLDLYLVAGNVEGLPPGVYLYDSEHHTLKLTIEGDIRAELCRAANSQQMVEQAPASIVYSATNSRTTDKYGERGRERYIYMDLGHSAENVYLQCEAMDLGTCAIGAFTDDKVAAAVGMTRNEKPLYIMPVGKATGDE